MTPRRDNISDQNEEDLEAYEVDGWRVGYEVEINGVGLTETEGGNNDDSDSFVSEGDSIAGSDEAVEDPYAHYQALPMQLEEENEDGSEQICCNSSSLPIDGASSVSSSVNPAIRKEFEKLLQESCASESNSQEVIPHQPVNINLDDEKIEAIRTAMSGFTLPPPPHMKNLDDQQLNAIIKEKLRCSMD